jgi:hypothetical protein
MLHNLFMETIYYNGNGITPMTFAEALAMFLANGKRSFSFVAAPYMVQKTVVIGNYGGALAVTPEHLYTKDARP